MTPRQDSTWIISNLSNPIFILYTILCIISQCNGRLVLQKGAPGFALSNPPMLELSCMEATLDIFQRASMTEIRNKSILLTGYLEYLLTVGFEDNARLKGMYRWNLHS